MKKLIIFREQLLSLSETFVREQVDCMTRYSATYVGLKEVPGLSLPGKQKYIIADDSFLGELQSKIFRVFGTNDGLAGFLSKERPAVIHAHFEGSGAMIAPMAAKLSIPLVVTCHGFDVTQRFALRQQWYRQRQRKILQRKGRFFIGVSEFIKKRMLAVGYPADRTLVHHIGVNVEKFKPVAGIEREDVVLFVGRLVEKKGCKFLVRAMREIQKVKPSASAVILGDGSLRAELELLSGREGVNCRFLGWQSHEAIMEWMSKARMLCCPSVTAASGDSEGLPTVVCEAQAAGLPVVGFNHAGIPEAIVDGETGFIVPEGDWKLLAERILTVFEQEDLWKRMSAAGRMNIERNFNIRLQSRKLEDIYESVSSGQGLII